MALSIAAKEAIYLKRPLKEMNCHPDEKPIVIMMITLVHNIYQKILYSMEVANT